MARNGGLIVMHASSSLRIADSVMVAAREALLDARERVSGTPQLAKVFFSGEGADRNAQDLLELAQSELGGVPVLGGVVDVVVGTGQEIEGKTAVSVLLLSDLGGEPRWVVLECQQTPDGWSVMGIDEDLHRDATACGGLMVVACPQTFSAEMLYASLENVCPEGEAPAMVLGGNVSRMNSQSDSVLFAGDRIVREGAVGLLLPPTVQWSTVVSQGCRPIGEPMVITEAKDRCILALGGKPALDRLREMFSELPNREREMAMRLLLLGRAITEYSETFSHGEFLIRNITGVDRDTKGIQVADRVKVGQTVRFHLLDAAAADADLKQLASRAKASGLEPKAGCLISCNGRGVRMFDALHHDAGVLDFYFAGLPMTGFFAAGEFGPIAGRNLVHGFTAVAVMLCEKQGQGH